MKTIQQALIDEIHYPIPMGFVYNKLVMRELNPDDECTSETLNSKGFMGAIADCLVSLIAAPNFSEADKQISMTEKSNILKWANSIYKRIGESENIVEEKPNPTVYVGDCLL